MTNPLRTALALALLSVAGWAGVAGVPTPAVAESGPVTVDFHCTYPLIGPRALSVAISTNLPATIEAGTPTPPVEVTSVATISADTTPGLVMVGSKSLTGSAVASAHVSGPSTDLDLEVPATLEQTTVPASGAFATTARATIEPLTFPVAGAYTITVDDLLLSITPHDAAGRKTGLDSFDSDCALDPGQETVVATVEVTDDGTTTPPTTEQEYDVSGSSYLKASSTTVGLSGSAAFTFDGTTSAVAADLAFAPTTATLRMYLYFPVIARILLSPTAATTGTLESGILATRSTVSVRVPSVTFFGLPVAGGPSCRTATPATLPLRSGAGFEPAKGGLLTGTYAIPSLTDCGAMTGALNQALAGPGNTARLTLAP